jgi:MFS family permease
LCSVSQEGNSKGILQAASIDPLAYWCSAVNQSQTAHSPTIIALTGLGALALAMGIGRFAFTPILPMMQVDVGLSIAGGGWLAAANYVGSLLGALSAMAISFSAAIAIRGGLVTIGIATIAMAFASDVAAWFALRLLAGFAVGLALPCASAWALEKLEPVRRPVLNATVFSGYGVGIATAGTACLVLMEAGVNAAQAWAALGFLSLAFTALIWPVLRMDRADGSVVEQCAPVGRYWRNAGSGLLVLCYGVFGFGYIIPTTFLPVMARQVIEDPLVFGWAWPILGIAAAGSTFIAAGWSTAIGNRRLWGVGHLVMAVGIALPVVVPRSIASIMLSAILVGSTFTIITMAGFQEGRMRGGLQMVAGMASAFSLGQIIGPIAVSATVDADGNFSTALVIASLLLSVSAWIVLRVRPPAFAV